MLDYHIHTPLCGHATGEMDAYVQQALRCQLQEIGFSDHLPMFKWGKPEYAMAFDDLPEYVRRVQELQRQYPQLPIKLGIEADYYAPDVEAQTRDLLAQYPFDYVYGSVHLLDGWPLDDPRFLHQWASRDVNQVYEEYFARLRQAARSGLFDILAHVDLVKKFGYRPTTDLSEMVDHTAQVIKASGVAVEINTSGLRRPVGEIYPTPELLCLFKQYDVPVVFGSDAHKPEEVGCDFDRARAYACDAGYTESMIFTQRKVVGASPL